MRLGRMAFAMAALFALGIVVAQVSGRSTREEEIAAFNKKYQDLHLKMDMQGVYGTWAEDGVDLMPGEAPIVGKKAIVAFVDNILAGIQGYKVTRMDMDFHDIEVSGNWASEWATEHQVVQPPDGKEPIEVWGKMALILHREANGEWKVKQEMWNQGKKP